MKISKGFKIGGLQHKLFALVLIFLLLLVGVYAAVSVWQQRNLTGIIQETREQQEEAIVSISEETMDSVLEVSMSRSSALQAYIADDLFNDVKADVLALQEVATEIFENAESFPPLSGRPALSRK